MKKEQRTRLLTASIIAGSMGLAAPAFADGEVVFSSWGGSFQDALRSAMLDPAAKALNVTVKEDTTNGIQDVRAQITAGAVAWDVTEQDLPSCETLSREGSLEPIDYSIVDTTGIPEDWIHQLHQGDRLSQGCLWRQRPVQLGRVLGSEKFPWQARHAWQGELQS